MKKVLLLWLALALLALGCAAQAEGEASPRGYVKGEGYQYFAVGAYPQGKNGETAPLLWRALDVTDGRALLLTEYVIEAQQIIFESDEATIKAHSYRRIESYADSDQCTWMNTVMLPAILGDTGLESALVAGEFGKLYPLTDEQYLTAAYGFSSARYGEIRSRQAKPTEYARSVGVYRDRIGTSPYWVANVKTTDGYKMQIVGYNGHLSYGAYTRKDIGIRPAMTLDLSLCDITGGDGSEEAPFEVALKETEATATTAPEELPKATLSAPTAENTVSPAPGPTATVTPQGDQTAEGVLPEATLSASIAPGNQTAAGVLPEATLYASAPEATAAPEPTAAPVTISLIGDCSIGDAYQNRNRADGLTDVIAKNGTEWPFSLVSKYLKSDDLTVANLEVCLTDSSKHVDKVYPLVAPTANVKVLTDGGIDAVDTVNNHCFDFGTQGYDDTLATLDLAGILHFGHAERGGKTYSDLTTVVDVGGIRFGFTGFSYPQNETLTVIGEKIQELRDAGCDVVVVGLHWGRETYTTPNSGQPSYAAKIIDLGADVVWGHHPHVLQPVQFYKGKPVFFSVGNFIFGTMSKVDPSTGIFQLQYEKTEDGAALKSLTVIPCNTQSSGDYRPFEVTDEDARQKVFKLLRYKKAYKGYENLPESFLTTGVVEVNADGTLADGGAE